MIIGKIVTRGSKLHIFNWIKRNNYLSERLNIEELSEDEKQNISYISALSTGEIRALINDKVVQLELFSGELVEI